MDKELTQEELQKVMKIFLSTYGRDLNILKKMIDYDRKLPQMEKIVFGVFKDSAQQKILLGHLKAEGEKLKKNGFSELALASDIDDTVYPSQYDHLKDEDKKLATDSQGAYKGLKEFHSKFDYLVFVTARPYGESTYENTHKKLDELGVNKDRAISMGKLWKIWQNKTRVRRKVNSLDHLTQIYPEYSFIWIGDNGEGDFDTGSKIRKEKPEKVPLVLIHQINKNHGAKQRFIDWVQGIKNHKTQDPEQNIYFFKSYDEALSIVNTHRE
jgi:hypothetical protein